MCARVGPLSGIRLHTVTTSNCVCVSVLGVERLLKISEVDFYVMKVKSKSIKSLMTSLMNK